MSKLRHIVLIDDHETTNFYHKYILEQSDIVEEVSTVDNLQDAFVLLEDLCAHCQEHLPCFIFLDINLPRYSGFEFIEMNRALIEQLRSKGVRLFLLSSSQNPKDIEQASVHPLIDDFLEKPLTVEIVKNLMRGKE